MVKPLAARPPTGQMKAGAQTVTRVAISALEGRNITKSNDISCVHEHKKVS